MTHRPPFDALIEKHSAEIFAYVWRLARNPQDAEDCLQETFLRAFRAYDRLTHADNLRAWLDRIDTNTTFAFLKKGGRESGRLVEVDPELVEHGDGPAEAVMQRETLRELARAVDRLPARQQAALVLRNYQQMSYSEIASALNCSEEAARANV